MDDEDEENEYLTEEDIRQMITDANSIVFKELAELSEKWEQIDKRLDKYERRIENLERKVTQKGEPMIEVPIKEVTDAIAARFVDRAMRPVPVKMTTTDPRKTRVLE